MGPLGFLTGVVLGSAASIALVLGMVLVIFLAVSPDHPALLEEYAYLVLAVLRFGVLAAVAAAAFAGLQKKLRWRWVAQGAMWLALAAIGWSYWPQGGA